MRRTTVMLVALLAAAASPAMAAEGAFGFIGLKAPKIESIPKWVAVLERIRSQAPQLISCLENEANCADRAQVQWRNMVIAANELGATARMNAVNDFFNDYRYITDDRLYGRSDVWATPREFIELSGDCEDYSIAKYFTLRQLGFAEADLRLLVVHDSVRGIAHAVLGVKLNGTEYVLDNLATRAVPMDAVRQYTPYYAVNAQHRWVFVQPLTP
jgi:predicted transglutaminase-like cysteine proteinase